MAEDLARYITVAKALARLGMRKDVGLEWLRERSLIRTVGRTLTGRPVKRVYLASLAAAMETAGAALAPPPPPTATAGPARGRRPAKTLEELRASARGR